MDFLSLNAYVYACNKGKVSPPTGQPVATAQPTRAKDDPGENAIIVSDNINIYNIDMQNAATTHLASLLFKNTSTRTLSARNYLDSIEMLNNKIAVKEKNAAALLLATEANDSSAAASAALPANTLLSDVKSSLQTGTTRASPGTDFLIKPRRLPPIEQNKSAPQPINDSEAGQFSLPHANATALQHQNIPSPPATTPSPPPSPPQTTGGKSPAPKAHTLKFYQGLARARGIPFSGLNKEALKNKLYQKK